MVKRILSLDGGGVKGIIVLHLLSKIEEQFNINIHEYFDLFAGTSTGALIATLFAYKKLSAKQILTTIYTIDNLRTIMFQTYYDKWIGSFQYKSKYSDKGKIEIIQKYLFDDSTNITQLKTNITKKLDASSEQNPNLIIKPNISIDQLKTEIICELKEKLKEELKNEIKEEVRKEISKSLCEISDSITTDVKQNTELLNQTILFDDTTQSIDNIVNKMIDDKIDPNIKKDKCTLFCVEKHILITAYDPCLKMPVFFRNYFGNSNFLLLDVLNATSAAPSYFPIAKVTNLNDNSVQHFIDGGVCNNNPSNIAYIDIKRLYPTESIEILSIGTGISKSTFNPLKDVNLSGLEWLIQESIIDVILDGNQLMSHICTDELATENKDKYLRINKYLTYASGKMDDTTDLNYNNLIKEGELWWEKSKDKLISFFAIV